MQLVIATASRLPEVDRDETSLLAALASRGVEASLRPWDSADPTAWADAIPTVLRSTWNYIHALPAFLAWARARPTLWNPADVVAGNVHKRYLGELAAAGHAVVPTLLIERGQLASRQSLDAIGRAAGLVIKPAVSAGSFKTFRFAAGERAAALAQARALARSRDILVQPYLESVETHGERALVWIDGAFTHAVRKSPRFAGQEEQVSAALPIEADERALGEAILAPLAARLLYARVDLARDQQGRPCLMELELIEPSLFLLAAPAALERLVDALVARLRRR
jgi:hypothetical protein